MAAIFAGNGIVLKCSENVIWSTQWFVDAVRKCLRACGHDEELVQVRCLRIGKFINEVLKIGSPFSLSAATLKLQRHSPSHLSSGISPSLVLRK